MASLERLIFKLEKVLEAPGPLRSRGAVWTRISVTPDHELSVRGYLECRECVLFEQLTTFGDVITETKRHGHLIHDQNIS